MKEKKRERDSKSTDPVRLLKIEEEEENSMIQSLKRNDQPFETQEFGSISKDLEIENKKKKKKRKH